MAQNQLKTLSTVTEVIAAFGGASRLADWAGHGQPMVSNWQARGYIPPGWAFKLFDWARAHGYEIKPSVFGHEPDPRPNFRASSPAHA